jgi:hypothetical protein
MTSHATRSENASRPVDARWGDSWSVLGLLGLTFGILGVADIALGVFPITFGSSEWAFGTFSAVLNGFAIPTLGAYLYLASRLATGSDMSLRVTAAVLGFGAIALFALAFAYLSVVPIALESAGANTEALLVMKKGIAKALILNLAYIALYAFGAVKAWRSASSRA